MPDDHGKKLISWKFPEYQAHKRGKVWHISFFTVGAISAVYAFFTANFLFMMIIVITWIIIYVTGRRKPKKLHFLITEDGIEVENHKFYPWDTINKFWIIYNPPESKFLYFNFKSSLRPDLVIPFERANPIKTRETLLRYIDEDLEKEDESLAEMMNREYKL